MRNLKLRPDSNWPEAEQPGCGQVRGLTLSTPQRHASIPAAQQPQVLAPMSVWGLYCVGFYQQVTGPCCPSAHTDLQGE